MSTSRKPIAVLGAGNVGMAMSAYLTSRGHPVHLFSAFDQEVLAVREASCVTATGTLEGTFRLDVVTSNPADALQGVELAVLCVPAFAQLDVLKLITPFLGNTRAVLLHPGSVGGALEAHSYLRESGLADGLLVGESASSLLSCRKRGPAQVHIRQVKRQVAVAAIPAKDTSSLLDALAEPFEHRFRSAESVLHTSLNNINPVYHCPPILANLGRIEDSESWAFADTVTPATVRLIERLDQERLALGRACGVANLVPFSDYLTLSYGVDDSDLLHRIRRAYTTGGGSPLPNDLGHRFLSEDVPFGLVPWLSLAAICDIELSLTQALVEVASIVSGREWKLEGRDLSHLADSVEDLEHLVMEGVRD